MHDLIMGKAQEVMPSGIHALSMFLAQWEGLISTCTGII